MDIYNDEFLLLTSIFEKNQVKYLVIGGFAVNRYGYKRTTGDLDIYLKDTKENRQNLIIALEEIGYGRFDMLMDAPIIAGYCEILMDNGMYADLMTEVKGLKQVDFEEHFNMATVDIVNEIPVRFLHFNHLIDNKKATGRSKDLLDIEELEKIRNNP